MNFGLIKEFFIPISILDIGACFGSWYQDCKNVFPNAYYYLIEANVECECHLKSLDVDYFMGAISDTNSIKRFYKTKKYSGCHDMTTGNSFYRELTDAYEDDNLIFEEIKTYTLDFLFPNKIFDLIKMDVQGAELDIIRGGVDIISNTKGLILEVSLEKYNIGAPLKNEIVEHLSGIGFTKNVVLAEVRHEIFNPVKTVDAPSIVHQQDILFLNEKFLEK